MIRSALLAACALIPSAAATFGADPPKVELKDGDRIVYLGNTFAERDQSYGYLETLLTITRPDIRFTFRNLGWSGDTVWGDARARFGTRAEGFKHLKDHVLALKPTIILVAYGMNESFEGEAGLPEFEKGLNALLDTLAETKARIVLISPIPHEDLGRPLPDPSAHNADLVKYCETITRIASARGALYVDLFAPARKVQAQGVRLTDDGLHPTPRGYAILGVYFFTRAMRSGAMRSLALDEDGAFREARGWDVEDFAIDGRAVRFRARGLTLPAPVVPAGPGHDRPSVGLMLALPGFGRSLAALKVDGADVQRDESMHGETLGEAIFSGPEIDQVEKLRTLINRKNELYFHRWRPQNETYLFGFRKHEQGNNAVEIPRFDPLVAELEAEIARLKKPVNHTYELIREGAGR